MAGKRKPRDARAGQKKKAAKPLSSRERSVYSQNVLKGFFPTPPNKAMETIMSKSKSQMDKALQDASSAGREGIEAFIKSSTLFSKGLEEIIRTSTAMAQGAAEKQARFVNQAMSSKTLNEWTEMQNKIAQSNFDDFMSGITRISEMSIKVMTECTEPLNDQIGKSIRKASESLAA